MKLVLCGSMTFADRMKDEASRLASFGLTVLLPEPTSPVESDDAENVARRKSQQDLIRRHWHKIREADAILVLNYDKDDVRGYVGGNTFLEMGFAHVLNKRIFMLNPVPDLSYTPEMKAMSPTVLDGRVDEILNLAATRRA